MTLRGAYSREAETKSEIDQSILNDQRRKITKIKENFRIANES